MVINTMKFYFLDILINLLFRFFHLALKILKNINIQVMFYCQALLSEIFLSWVLLWVDNALPDNICRLLCNQQGRPVRWYPVNFNSLDASSLS